MGKTVSGLLGMALMVSGCVSTPEPVTNYFLLNSTSNPSDAVVLESFRLGVGPVELAPYLDDEGIAIHDAANQITYAEYQRWAEPLESNISRVLLSNMTTLLPKQTVYGFPWRVAQTPEYQLRLNINRFGWFPDNQVRIEARITLENRQDEIVFSSEETMSLRAAGVDYRSNVAAQNALLDAFSRRLVSLLEEEITE